MYRKSNILFLMSQTPMHAGSGDSLGIVDLPIQRERHTSFPKIEASSLKGAIREAFEDHLVLRANDEAERNLKKINIAFGYDKAPLSDSRFNKEHMNDMFKEGDKDKSEFAGALGFTDARLLLFPVKSMKGVFAWITCPYVLEKLKNELENVCLPKINVLNTNDFKDLEMKTCNLANLQTTKEGKVMLEEYTFTLDETENSQEIAKELAELTGNQDINKRLVILPNTVFSDFVTNYTEVVTRTKISNETGTVESGALFTEEYLPAETIMYSLVLYSPVFSEKKNNDFSTEEHVFKFFKNIPKIIQIGGNSTLGKGLTKTNIYENGQ